MGRAVAEALGLEMFDKDDVLEELFNKEGVGDKEWRRALSRDADEILREQALQAESSVIVSWWRHPASNLSTGTPTDWLSELHGELIEVYCVCDPLIAAERFKSRKRHSGHLDHLKPSTDLLQSFEQHASLGPLRVGRLIEVNTERHVELADLLSAITTEL